LFARWVVPLSVIIILALFVLHAIGTHRVGNLVRPDHGARFITVFVLGVWCGSSRPLVLMAVILITRSTSCVHGLSGFAVLGPSCWLSLAARRSMPTWATSASARSAWLVRLVLPALLLNYFGQGALLLTNPKAIEQPFFLLAPKWALFPLVALASLAAIIASQALISGAFSLTRQAIQLGYSPRLDISHTSSHEIGQVYVPQVNWTLMVCTILIVIGFGSSTALAAAYGIAVTLTMVITAVLLYVVARDRWHWPTPVALAVTGLFLLIDLAFFGANVLKIRARRLAAARDRRGAFTLMTTWKTGRRSSRRLTRAPIPLEDVHRRVVTHAAGAVPGTACS
jgi:KUP system potassium uptake protein